jgi:lipopolysaccharide export system protein LptA
MIKFALLALAASVVLSGPAMAQAAKPAPGDRSSAFGNLGSNKEPIKIDADRLDVFDKESRAVFEGNVVAVQGDSTVKCTMLTVFYEPRNQGAGAPAAAAPSAQAASSDSSIKKIDCKGPVTIVSRTQVATGENATFDRGSNKILLTGNATLSDGPNVTKGERVLYDINTGVANIETTPGGRVRALFVPGNGGPAPTGAGGGAPAAGNAKPKPQQRPATN